MVCLFMVVPKFTFLLQSIWSTFFYDLFILQMSNHKAFLRIGSKIGFGYYVINIAMFLN